MRTLFTPVLFLFLSVSLLNGQDIHFSQFYMSPLNLNPAMTGVMNCTDRVTMVYRNQWASVMRSNAFNTAGVSYDKKIAIGRKDYWGVGINFWADRAGESNFSTISPQLAVGYSKYMGGSRKTSHYLAFGIEGGGSQRNITLTNLKWGLQAKDGSYDPTLPSGENTFNMDPNFWFGELSAGLLWFSNFKGMHSLYIGGAYSHLTRPNQSFFKNDRVEPLYSKITVHGGGDISVNERFSIVPGFVTFFQGPSFQVNGGTSFRFWLDRDRWTQQDIQFGIWARISNHWQKALEPDAIILSTKIDYNQFSLGFSYDLNISSLTPASNSNGAFELALGYLFCGKEKRGVYCPTF